MKFAKKTIMVPEAEYHSLLNAFRGGDYLQNEKALLDAKIMQNLEDPTISEDLKASRHSWLYKERRMIKRMVDNRPQRVVIVNQNAAPNVAPYLGVSQPNSQATEEPRKFIVPTKRLRREENESEEVDKNLIDENMRAVIQSSSNEEEPPFEIHSPVSSETSSIFKTPEKLRPTTIIHPNLLGDLFNYVSKNKDTFKITARGKVQSNKNLPIDDSNYKNVLKYLAGEEMDTPRGAKFLKDRLLKDAKIREMVDKSSAMWGKGAKNNPIKNTGTLQQMKKPFKPTLWARL